MGVSHLISAGNEAVLHIGDYLDYLADDDAFRLSRPILRASGMGAAFCRRLKKLLHASR
jgi:acyl-CoA synthetase (NDP forming)